MNMCYLIIGDIICVIPYIILGLLSLHALSLPIMQITVSLVSFTNNCTTSEMCQTRCHNSAIQHRLFYSSLGYYTEQVDTDQECKGDKPAQFYNRCTFQFQSALFFVRIVQIDLSNIDSKTFYRKVHR